MAEGRREGGRAGRPNRYSISDAGMPTVPHSHDMPGRGGRGGRESPLTNDDNGPPARARVPARWPVGRVSACLLISPKRNSTIDSEWKFKHFIHRIIRIPWQRRSSLDARSSARQWQQEEAPFSHCA